MLRSALASSVFLGVVGMLTACGGGDGPASEQPAADGDAPNAPTGEASTMSGSDNLMRLLSEGQAVFGMFSGDKTPEQARAMAANQALDFVFYSLETGPFDIPTMEAYISGMAGTSYGAHPITLRIPPVGGEPEMARERIVEGMAGGAQGIVVPHVQTRAQAEVAIAAIGDENWPTNPSGTVFNILIIEDREGIQNAADIVATPGISVAIPGPGDLRRAYEGDMVAVEGAIQEVLQLCKDNGVLCGITAGAADIAERIEQGFRVIIVTEPEAVTVGRAAAGRAP